VTRNITGLKKGNTKNVGRDPEKNRAEARKCFYSIGGWKEFGRLYNKAEVKEKIKILEDVLDRGWGKPEQSMTIPELSKFILNFPKGFNAND
jgi:hypothetical protein